MIRQIALVALVGVFSLNVAVTQEVVIYKAAVVVLVEDSAVRADFEESLAAKFREHNYDAITTYDFLPETTGVDGAGFAGRLAEQGIQVILMLRPAAIGAGSTLESVQGEVRSWYAKAVAAARIHYHVVGFRHVTSPAGRGR